jgi:hypothetical protein
MRIFSFILISIFLLFLIISCNIFENDHKEIDYFKIKVDTITIPSNASIGDTLIFKLDGFIGPDGCHSFSHFSIKRSNNESIVTVWGKHLGETCTQAVVFLDGKEYKVKVNIPGKYYLKIRQPDNSLLIDSVYVNQPLTRA